VSAKGTKGQGVPNRKRILEARHGKAATREVRKHLEILRKYKQAVLNAANVERFVTKKMPGFDESRIEAQKRKLGRLEGLLLASFLKVSQVPETLRNLADIAEVSRDGRGYSFPEEVTLLEFWDAGRRSYKGLFKVCRLKNSQLTPQHFSKIVRHYEECGRIAGIRRGKDDPKELSLREQKKRLKQAENDTLEALKKISQAEHAEQVERQWRKHKAERKKQ